jgi:ABC-2 type transport system permease protein
VSAAWRIAREEWRYWARSRLALAATGLLALVLLSTLALTALEVRADAARRAALQDEARETFLSQPARHPHRMVHYGHFVFRSPAPLAVFDPGLDPVTGQAIYLEGHRQNTAAFAPNGSGASLGGMPSLTPAMVYQVFAPLLLIILGFAAVARERESSTLLPLLAQGASGRSLLLGKSIALAAVAAVLVVPVAVAGLATLAQGESLGAVLTLTAVCGLYLLGWCAIIVAASAVFRSRHAALAALAALWIGLALVMPVVAATYAARSVATTGKTEGDLRMLAELRRVGDGHNAADPAFARLRTDLLASYGVERPEDLPVNLRGVVAQYAEEKLTRVLVEHAEARMAEERAQAQAAQRFGWLSPAVAFASASRALAGTDLESHHRFLRESEALRFGFVQALNRVHAEELDYADDIRRSQDADAERRTRVDPAFWQVLDEFRFTPRPAAERRVAATPSLWMLLLWLVVPAAVCLPLARRLETSP